MSWLIIAIFAYFLLAITAVIDKYLLSGPPNPKSYSFYVGILGILVLILIPFVNFSIPETCQFILSFLAGSIFVLALFGLYTGLEKFEASRIVPAIGGFLPIFTFILVYLFPGEKTPFSLWEISAFIFLLLGSIIITFEKGKLITLNSLKISAISAFLFSLSFVLAKYVYLAQPFWSGFILMRVGGFLTAILFLFSKEMRSEIFGKKFIFQKRTGLLFLSNQAIGAGAFILQNWAIVLVPLGLLAFVNVLEGTKYVFLLIFTLFLSLKFPQIIKEDLSRKTIFQKIAAILLIGTGLIVLAFK